MSSAPEYPIARTFIALPRKRGLSELTNASTASAMTAAFVVVMAALHATSDGAGGRLASAVTPRILADPQLSARCECLGRATVMSFSGPARWPLMPRLTLACPCVPLGRYGPHAHPGR